MQKLRFSPQLAEIAGVPSCVCMKVSFPLWLKVTIWLLLNLALLGAIAVGFFVVQGGLGWNALLAGATGNRAQARANFISAEVATTTADQREAVLARLGSTYGAQFTLHRLDDQNVIGPKLELPAPVAARIESSRGQMRMFFGPGRGARGGFGGPDGSREKGGFRRESPEKMGEKEGARPTTERRPPPDLTRERENTRFIERAGAPRSFWFASRVAFVDDTRGGRPVPAMLVARIDSFWALMRFLQLESWLLGAGAALGLSVLFWLPLIFGITRAIGQLTRATEQIAEGRFDTRVSAGRRDEIGKLGDSVNRMAARLDAHMTGQKRFLGDVAHELCSPLARLQMASGILDEQAPPKFQPMVAEVRDEVQQMSTLVNELLAFTKSGLQSRDVALQPVELAPLVADALKREAATERVTATVPPGLRVMAEPVLLERAIGNLVRNALRYAGESGPITVTAQRENSRVVMAVEDNGPGVPGADIDRLGEPFFRPELARTRETGGVGLGLAIVRNSVVASGGEVRFSNRSPRGFRAEVRLAAA